LPEVGLGLTHAKAVAARLVRQGRLRSCGLSRPATGLLIVGSIRADSARSFGHPRTCSAAGSQSLCRLTGHFTSTYCVIWNLTRRGGREPPSLIRRTRWGTDMPRVVADGSANLLAATTAAALSLQKRSGTTSAWHDVRRDWRRWTKAEQVSAALIGALTVVGLPAAIFFNLHPN
jgi:hypothetical protein